MKSYQQFLPIPENLRPAIKAGPKASSTMVPFWLLLLLLLQSYPTLSDPTDSSPPGSPVHGIFQARVLKWSAIAFSALSAESTAKISKKSKSALLLSQVRNSKLLLKPPH